MIPGAEDRLPEVVNDRQHGLKPSVVLLVAAAALAQVVLYAWAGATAIAYALTVGLCHR